MNQAEQGQPTDFVVGVLLSKVEHSKMELWNVQCGNTGIQLLANDFENAFPPGQRVVVNWQESGEMFLGCVVVWGGGSRYKVWFDQDQKPYTVFGANLSLSNAPLPKSFPKKYRALIGEGLVSSPSSSFASFASSSSLFSTLCMSSHPNPFARYVCFRGSVVSSTSITFWRVGVFELPGFLASVTISRAMLSRDS
jgi:hypothetical protein